MREVLVKYVSRIAHMFGVQVLSLEGQYPLAGHFLEKGPGSGKGDVLSAVAY